MYKIKYESEQEIRVTGTPEELKAINKILIATQSLPLLNVLIEFLEKEEKRLRDD